MKRTISALLAVLMTLMLWVQPAQAGCGRYEATGIRSWLTARKHPDADRR